MHQDQKIMSCTISWLFLATVSTIFVGITAVEIVVEFQWSYINYTWKSRAQYQEAMSTGKYIPENVFPVAMKLYDNKIYLATPEYKGGVPFTLSYISKNATNKTNTPLVPFPNSILNKERNCSNLQNVKTLEIDAKGIMWVVDGVRLSTSNCPPKLQLFDLNKGGRLIHTYVFANEYCLQKGCHMTDIVVDEKGHCYITDASFIDPGLVVYCPTNNTIGKFRDATMFPQKDSPKYSIDNYPVNAFGAINGIALSPISPDKSKSRTIFYAPVTGYDLFSVPADDVRNETLYNNGLWRKSITLVGKKQGATKGMMMDNLGNLYYTLISLNAIGKWNINQPFDQSEIFYKNETMVWPSCFGMDKKGYLFLLANRAINYIAPNVTLSISPEIKFRIYKFSVGSKSYQQPN